MLTRSCESGPHSPLRRLLADSSVSVGEQVLENSVSDAETLHLLFARLARQLDLQSFLSSSPPKVTDSMMSSSPDRLKNRLRQLAEGIGRDRIATMTGAIEVFREGDLVQHRAGNIGMHRVEFFHALFEQRHRGVGAIVVLMKNPEGNLRPAQSLVVAGFLRTFQSLARIVARLALGSPIPIRTTPSSAALPLRRFPDRDRVLRSMPVRKPHAPTSALDSMSDNIRRATFEHVDDHRGIAELSWLRRPLARSPFVVAR